MNLWIFIIGYASIQSVLLIYLLISSKEKGAKGINYLIWLLITTTYIGIHYVFTKLGYRQTYPALFIVGFSPMFLIPPLYLLFLYRLIGDKKNSLRTFLHFIPFIVFLSFQYSSFILTFKRVIFLAFAIQLLIYSLVSLAYIKKIQDSNEKSISVLKYLTICMILLAISVCTLYISTIIFKTNSIDLTAIITIFLVLFVTILEVHMVKGFNNPFGFTFNIKKYKSSNLQLQNIDTLEDKLEKLITTDKVFLNHNLKPNDVAQQLNISRHQLTEFINQELECSFNELINRYRVEFVKKALLDKNKKHFSISGLANEAGFKSTATFYRVFKKITNLTPSEFIIKK